VRAPNLSELFAAPQVSNNQIVNNLNNKTLTVQFVATGNPALVPEKSANTQLGVVFQPSWFPGFSTSVDYYRVNIKQGISSLGQQTEVNLCQLQGFTNECAAIITSNGLPESDPNSIWSQVKSEAFNLSYTVTDGFDFETSYQFSLNDFLDVPGDFVIRALGNHISKFQSNSGVPGTITTISAGAGSTPSWEWFGTQTYTNNDWSFTVTEKWISEGVLSRASIQCTSGCPLPTANNPTTNYNFVPSEFYFGIGGSYNLTDRWQTYFKVDNVANVAPPISPSASPNQYGANATLYDTIGRMFHVGFRFTN
jgi:iron complex outermembrane receptor protein